MTDKWHSYNYDHDDYHHDHVMFEYNSGIDTTLRSSTASNSSYQTLDAPKYLSTSSCHVWVQLGLRRDSLKLYDLQLLMSNSGHPHTYRWINGIVSFGLDINATFCLILWTMESRPGRCLAAARLSFPSQHSRPSNYIESEPIQSFLFIFFHRLELIHIALLWFLNKYKYIENRSCFASPEPNSLQPRYDDLLTEDCLTLLTRVRSGRN